MRTSATAQYRAAQQAEQPAVKTAASSSGPRLNITKTPATDSIDVNASTAIVKRQFQLPVRVNGWSGFHAGLVLTPLAMRAEAAGVKVSFEVVDKHWWKGTLYNVHCEGAAADIERLIAISLRAIEEVRTTE